MSRIRTIKPEFPQSETIGRLSRDARLLFIMLWTIADDDGRTRAASRMLASLLYPYDNDAAKLMDRWLDELEREKCIRRYEVDNSRYLEICNWLKHQKIDHPSKSRLPAFREASRDLAKDLPSLAPDLGPGPGPGPDSRRAADAPRPKSEGKILKNDPFDPFWAAYPKRKGDNPKKTAKAKFEKALENGADPEDIIAGAKKLAEVLKSENKINTSYVPMAVTWLNQERWKDYAAAPKGKPWWELYVFVAVGSPEIKAWQAYKLVHNLGLAVMNYPGDKTKTGAFVELKLPPDEEFVRVGTPRFEAWESHLKSRNVRLVIVDHPLDGTKGTYAPLDWSPQAKAA